MICPNQSNRGPLEEKNKNKCGSLPTADIVGAVGKRSKDKDSDIMALKSKGADFWLG